MSGKANERELFYGEKLGKMIRCETISNAFQQDLSKFYRFHEVLEQLFPNIHRVCEKHEFNGSLLFKWKGKGQGEPILFMSHQDVVGPPESGSMTLSAEKLQMALYGEEEPWTPKAACSAFFRLWRS